MKSNLNSDSEFSPDTEETEEPTDEAIEAHIEELLSGDPEDLDEISDYIDEMDTYYSDDICEFAFRAAIRCGAFHYVDAFADEFDLNDEGGYSTYLDETFDSEMEQLLMDHGAFRCFEDYDDCRFAYETVNGEVLAFDSDFQREVYEKYLSFTGLTEENVMELLDEENAANVTDALPEGFSRDVESDFSALGLSLYDGEICLDDITGQDGSSTMELLEELGYRLTFEGSSWKMETLGVYFIN